MLGAQVRTDVDQLGQADSCESLDDDAEAAVGQLEHLVDVTGGTDRVQVFL